MSIFLLYNTCIIFPYQCFLHSTHLSFMKTDQWWVQQTLQLALQASEMLVVRGAGGRLKRWWICSSHSHWLRVLQPRLLLIRTHWEGDTKSLWSVLWWISSHILPSINWVYNCGGWWMSWRGEMRESVVIQNVIDIFHTVDELWFSITMKIYIYYIKMFECKEKNTIPAEDKKVRWNWIRGKHKCISVLFQQLKYILTE